jgi:hypothetical protein
LLAQRHIVGNNGLITGLEWGKKGMHAEFWWVNLIEKTIVMAFRGIEPIRSKICINNKTLKQQNTFNCLGYNKSYEGEKDLNIKAANFVRVL